MVDGKKVGVITNDQAPDLVDTALLRARGLNVEEVAGSCFCCNFFGLMKATEALKKATDADILLAEPVGSCTDLAATLLQPMREMFARDFIQSPLTVLVDPGKLADLLNEKYDNFNEYTAYVCNMQLKEADIIAINKVDLIDDSTLAEIYGRVSEEFPHATTRSISARFGFGIDEWLQEVTSAEPGSARIVEVDYELYTKGEMQLGWYNADLGLTAVSGLVDWAGLCQRFLDTFQSDLAKSGNKIGHIKLLLSTAKGYLSGSITDFHSSPDIRVEIEEQTATAALTINARVEMEPEDLESAVSHALKRAFCDSAELDVKKSICKTPGRPEPTFRSR
jgi:Ni2+-binding GTPase involved in maturation of urease and hydrogenase